MSRFHSRGSRRAKQGLLVLMNVVLCYMNVFGQSTKAQVKDGTYEATDLKSLSSGGLFTFTKKGDRVTGIYSGSTLSTCYSGALRENVVVVERVVRMKTDYATKGIYFSDDLEGREKDRFRELHPATPFTNFPNGLLDPSGPEVMRAQKKLDECIRYLEKDGNAVVDEGQRDKAKRLACSAPIGSLGKEAICPNFDEFIVKILRNLCAGGVGDLYERNQKALAQPATDQNIEKWAIMETQYFKNQENCAAELGAVLSRERRIAWMKEARDRRKNRK